jgi:phosphonate transport system substrate-binding protein
MWSLLLAVSVISPQASATEDPPLRFGVFPRSSPEIMVRNYGPLARALGASLGRRVVIETDRNFASFMRRVYAREFDLVYLNQSQYVKAHHSAGYRAIAKLCESPACTISAQIVTRDDSGLNKISDLRGKTIAFGDPEAIVSYVLAKSILRAAGLQPRDYQQIFTRNPPNALLAVYNGTAQAAGIGSSLLQRPEILRNVDVKRLHVLASSQPIPQLPMAVRGDLDPRLAQGIRAMLLELPATPDGPAILEMAGALRFEAASDGEYAVVMRLMADETDAAP